VDDTFVIWPHGPGKLSLVPWPPEQYPWEHSFHCGDRKRQPYSLPWHWHIL
jgi:hypothetical protein